MAGVRLPAQGWRPDNFFSRLNAGQLDADSYHGLSFFLYSGDRDEQLGTAMSEQRAHAQKVLPLAGAKVAAWVRDPLLALGCRDPVDRVDELKRDDPHRRQVVDFFSAWRQAHGSDPVAVKKLDANVLAAAGLQRGSRQSVATFVANLVNTRAGGFQLRRERHGKWGASTYVVSGTDASQDDAGSPPARAPTARSSEHRGHRGHNVASQAER